MANGTRMGPPGIKSIRNEINVLKRKVGRNTPAPVSFLEFDSVGTFSTTGHSYLVKSITCTADLISRTDFRDCINGDEWYNNFVDLRFLMDPLVQMAWILVYTPNVASNSFVPSADDDGFLTIPDPAAFRVHSSRTFTRDTLEDNDGDPYTHKVVQYRVPLRGMKTTYNDSAGIIEKNPFKIMIMVKKGNGTSAGEPGGRLAWRVQLQDK